MGSPEFGLGPGDGGAGTKRTRTGVHAERIVLQTEAQGGPQAAGARPGAGPNVHAKPYRKDELLFGLKEWPLFEEYARQLGNSDCVMSADVHGHRGFLISALGLMDIVCSCCGGYGHTDRKCPTLGRLKVATGKNRLARHFLDAALKGNAKNSALHGYPPPLKSIIPYQ